MRRLGTFYKSSKDGEWNFLRDHILKLSLEKHLIPHICKYLYSFLLNESRKHIAKYCAQNLRSRLEVSEFRIPENGSIFAICVEDIQSPSFCVVLNDYGLVIDFVTLHFLKNSIAPKMARERNPQLQADSKIALAKKSEDLNKLQKLIAQYKPSLIVIGAEADLVTCESFFSNVKKACQYTSTKCSLINPDIARIFENSHRAKEEFPSYQPGLRNSISLGRLVLDPIAEICGLWLRDPNSKQRDVLSLQLHHLQDLVPNKIIVKYFERVFINVVNDYGVDINGMLGRPHKTPPLQHVCGLGPAYAKYILDKTQNFLRSRTNLINDENSQAQDKLGETVFFNCAGFIRILESPETKNIHNEDDDITFSPEYLDSTRIHPENYELARQIILLSMDIPDKITENKLDDLVLQGGPEMEEHIKTMRESHLHELNQMDLETFVHEFERQNQDGLKHEGPFIPTFYLLKDIVEELKFAFKSIRTPFQSLSKEKLF